MLSQVFASLASAAANKKVVAAWLIVLTAGVSAIGDKVFIKGTAELAVIQTKLGAMAETLHEIDVTTKRNEELLTKLRIELAVLQETQGKASK